MCEIDPKEMLRYLYEKLEKLEKIVNTLEDDLYPDSIDVWRGFNDGNSQETQT